MGYHETKRRAWAFVDRFNHNASFGAAEARAYVSALADAAVVERGLDLASALEEALLRAEALLKSGGPSAVAEDAKRAIDRWRGLPRGKAPARLLSSVQQPRGRPPRVRTGLKAVAVMTGAYALGLGLEEAGFDVAAAVFLDPAAARNYRLNRPFNNALEGTAPPGDVLAASGLSPGQLDLLAFELPAEPFSTAGRRMALADPRADAVAYLSSLLERLRPRALLLLAVPGILTAKALPNLPEVSAWKAVLRVVSRAGYRAAWREVEAADYCAPQLKRRVALVASRPPLPLPALPQPACSRQPSLAASAPWLTLAEALAGLRDPGPSSQLFTDYLEAMKYVPGGGNWRLVPEPLRSRLMGDATSGGRTGFFRRLAWFEPSPTLVASPTMKATMLIHPWEDRPLSVREYARLQGLPDSWVVGLDVDDAYRVLAEATPAPLARALAEALRDEVLEQVPAGRRA